MPKSWVISSVSVPFLFPEITCSVLWWKAHTHTEEHRDTSGASVRLMKPCPSSSKAVPGEHQPQGLGMTQESTRANLTGTAGQDWQEDRIRSLVLCLCISICSTRCCFQAVHTAMCVPSCTCWDHHSASLLAGPEAGSCSSFPSTGLLVWATCNINLMDIFRQSLKLSTHNS